MLIWLQNNIPRLHVCPSSQPSAVFWKCLCHLAWGSQFPRVADDSRAVTSPRGQMRAHALTILTVGLGDKSVNHRVSGDTLASRSAALNVVGSRTLASDILTIARKCVLLALPCAAGCRHGTALNIGSSRAQSTYVWRAACNVVRLADALTGAAKSRIERRVGPRCVDFGEGGCPVACQLHGATRTFMTLASVNLSGKHRNATLGVTVLCVRHHPFSRAIEETEMALAHLLDTFANGSCDGGDWFLTGII